MSRLIQLKRRDIYPRWKHPAIGNVLVNNESMEILLSGRFEKKREKHGSVEDGTTVHKQRARERCRKRRILGRRHYLEWCLDDVKASELKEGKRKASPKCGFASYDRYALVSRSGSRYTLATHHRSGYTQNATRKFIRSQPLSDAAAEPLSGETRPVLLLIPFSPGPPRLRESEPRERCERN